MHIKRRGVGGNLISVKEHVYRPQGRCLPFWFRLQGKEIRLAFIMRCTRAGREICVLLYIRFHKFRRTSHRGTQRCACNRSGKVAQCSVSPSRNRDKRT